MLPNPKGEVAIKVKTAVMLTGQLLTVITLKIMRRAPCHKAPCKRTQHVGATSPNIVGIALADVGFRVFKRSHVGQCCFYGNTLGSLV